MKHSVVLIEDDHDTRVCVRQLLEDADLKVYSSPNGVDALALLRLIKKPSLILLDQNMPLMNGDEFIDVKNQDEHLAPVPVVVMSAVPDRLTKRGALEFIPKPLHMEKLLTTVQKYCNTLQIA